MNKKLIPRDKQKLTYLKWQDAHSNSGWFTDDEITEKVNEEMYLVEDVGWVVYEDKNEIHLCSRLAGKTPLKFGKMSEYGMYQRIPQTWIIRSKILKV